MRSTLRDLRALAPRLAFWVWAPVTLILGAFLMAGHLLTLPKPAPTDPRLTAGMTASRIPGSEGKWMAMHVLYAQCRCSQKVFAHLLERRAASSAFEKIVLVDGDDELRRQAEGHGFAFESLTSAELAERYHLEAAPVMVVSDPSNVVRYLGGYTDRKQGVVIRDQSILRDLQGGKSVAALPLFGCAVSAELKASLDPLKLKN